MRDGATREEKMSEPLFCVNHPNVETTLRCNRCGDPICVRCAIRTPVGYRCPRCVREQQAAFYTGTALDYPIAALIALPLAATGAYFISFVGFFFAFFLSPVAGAIVSEAVWYGVRRRRTRHLWLVVGISIIVATLLVALYQAGLFAGYPLVLGRLLRLDLGIYGVMATSTAAARLRIGR